MDTKECAHRGTGTQEIKVPFPFSSFLPSSFSLLPSSFLPSLPFLFPPVAFTISASYKACSHPLFHLPFIRSYTHEGKVTNSILHMNKTKQSSGSRAKTGSFPMIQFYFPLLSTPFSIQQPLPSSQPPAFDLQDSLFR